MIIVSKTPLRISLAGGSTDLQEYLNKYGEGKVVSFTPNLYTYIILKKSITKYYKIVYSKIENVVSVDDIQNDIAREVLSYFEMPPVEVVFTADIPSSGSGLASSSSYLISMIKACLEFKKETMTIEQLGKLAIEIERRFNPLTGYQDIFGCLYDGLKSLSFDKNGLSNVNILSEEIFKVLDFHLIPVGNTRKSTGILSTIDFSEVRKLCYLADDMISCVCMRDYEGVCKIINEGWEIKKKTSPDIVNGSVDKIESSIKDRKDILAYRLLGAGSGGYFLIITPKGSEINLPNISITIHK